MYIQSDCPFQYQYILQHVELLCTFFQNVRHEFLSNHVCEQLGFSFSDAVSISLWYLVLKFYSKICNLTCTILCHIITKTPLFKYIENFISKNWKISDKKNSDSFHISAQNIDCGYSLEPPQRGGSNEYPQSVFLNRNKKNNAYPCKPQFYYIKVGFKGVKII